MNHNKLPLVSICIPTYNGSKYINETITSALNQSYNNIEIIITDDHSTDDTLSICQDYATKDARIKVFKNEKNLGLVGNWCESLEKASSNWVKFLFQDDLMTTNCVERMISSALEHNVNFVICNRTYFFENGVADRLKKFYNTLPKTETIFSEERVYTPKETSKLIAPFVFRNCIGEPPTLLLNKLHFSKADFSKNYFQLIDYIFVLNKILVHDFVYIGEKLIKFRVHNSSESNRNSVVNTEDKKAFYKFLHIKYHEDMQICNEIINNPIFSDIKKEIPLKDIIQIKNWWVLESYKFAYPHDI